MATVETAWKKTDGPVRYFDSEREVHLGDRVLLRGWFRRREASVNYVPGISEYHSEMEHNHLFWVGLAFDAGTFTGILVDPDTGCTLKNLVFLERGPIDRVDAVPEAPWE